MCVCMCVCVCVCVRVYVCVCMSLSVSVNACVRGRACVCSQYFRITVKDIYSGNTANTIRRSVHTIIMNSEASFVLERTKGLQQIGSHDVKHLH